MQKKTILLLTLVVLKFLLQYLLINPAYELHRDEFLHLDQGRHLAWGYISVPPVTSWISAIIRLLGNSVFLVKAVPALFGAATLVMVWKLAEFLKGGLFASVLASLSSLLTVMLRINLLYQPNSLDIFFWTLTYFTLLNYLDTGKPKWLYATALALAFGFLCKYNIAFLAAGLFPALLMSPHRQLFTSKHFYGALLLAIAIVSPNLIWQYQNGFPTYYQLKELAATQLVNVNRFDFVKEQFLFFVACSFVIIAAFIALLFYAPFKRYRFLVLAYLLTLLLFVYFKAKSYYAIGLYPVLMAFGATYLERILATGKRFYFRYAAIALVLILSVPFLLLAFPIYKPVYYLQHPKTFEDIGVLRWEDGKNHALPQDFADMVGWKELAQKVDSAYASVADKERTLVLCDNYGQAGAINYYSSFKNIRAVSFNADYIDWMSLDKPIRNVILVKENDDEDSTRKEEQPLFKMISLKGQIENPYAREKGTRIFLLENARADINKQIEEERAERKKK